MSFPLAVALLSVLGGTALGLVPRERAIALGRIRWFAVVASLAVVAGHLLPEAFEAIGWLSAVAFAAGLALPWLVEKLAHVLAARSSRAAEGAALASLELGYAGLVAHRFGDGLAMGAAWATGGALWGRVGVVVAISAHIVPVTTVMILALAAARGTRSALRRGLLLAASTGAGVLAAGRALESVAASTPGALHATPGAHAARSVNGANIHLHGAEAVVTALVAGLLVHIVTHREADGDAGKK